MYSKIYRQIFQSSIAEDYSTRHVFMDLIVLADPMGQVDMTLESIARITNVPLEIVAAAIGKLCKPDVNSRSPDHDGKRLVLLDEGRNWGWQIVNFKAYHEMRDEDARREYMKGYMQRRRDKQKKALTPVNTVNTRKHSLAHEDVYVDVNVNEVKKQPSSASPTSFDEFWKAYPSKVGKKAAEKAWLKAKDKPDLAAILAAIEKQKSSERWQNGYIPNPATWLNQGRWLDEVREPKRGPLLGKELDPNDPYFTNKKYDPNFKPPTTNNARLA